MPHAVRTTRPAPALTATGIARRFGSTRALADATLEVRAGEVHGLLGANGAGKSTLSRIISGHIARDSGTLTYEGRPLDLRSTREALDIGIALVAQETSLAPDLSVLENIFLPELGRAGRLSFGQMRRRAQAILAGLGHEHVLPLDAEVRLLSAAQRQLVEIAKALALEASLLIFDEPTASLSPTEVDRLFDIMARLRADGRALIFVSHRLEEVFTITDRVTILREGRTVAAGVETAGLSQSDIIRHMVGRDLGAIHAAPRGPRPAAEGPPALEVSGLRAAPHVRDVSFSVRAGEILGLGGLVGAGRSEAAEALFGLRRRDAGTVKVKGREIAPRKPADAIRHGIGFVAEDRRAQNIVPDLTVRENLMLAHIGRHRGFGLGYGRRQGRLAELLEKLGLPENRLDTGLLTFSGGMQQKVIIARWLLIEPTVLILDEPTKGVDIGTRAAIYRILREIADDGVAVVVISSDFEELLGLTERVVVMSDGMTIANLPTPLLTEEKLTLLAAPRSSTGRNRALLDSLAQAHDGVAFWALLDAQELICLGQSAAPGAPGIGLRIGEAVRNADTAIATALRARADGFVAEPAPGPQPEHGADAASALLPARAAGAHAGALRSAGTDIPPDAHARRPDGPGAGATGAPPDHGARSTGAQGASPGSGAAGASGPGPGPDTGLTTLLIGMHTARGHDLGWIGLTLRAGRPLPDPAEIRRQVALLTASDPSSGAAS
ncbi:ATP-binding cassette domain-containing protein (plasmid) [Paroceanicella profunda]|uniref:ATP-binding cassette domain-containing protein n=1 Tax=Paroceanicella profunda TaxID=2579971 RepID=A0A5B8G3F5_9RHOB|nr:sugar ABC transporter ATP-binding protein [Paroceanicella profunda]QDL94500.1 ATP-binding cassette domain-containing protein [Paroceanicella profunda]